MVTIMDINSLPVETFIQILKATDGVTLGKCRRVSKRWMDVIDSTDLIWQYYCEKDYKIFSRIVKRKSGNECKWYHIYKNLKMWETIDKSEKNLKQFYQFNLHDKNHALDVDYSVLALRDAKGTVMYDMTTLKYIPVAFPERCCIKMCNNDNATALLIKSGLLIQRSVTNPTHTTETFLKANDFVMAKDVVYFFYNRDVFKVDLLLEIMLPKLILHCDYDIKTIQYTEDTLCIFTDCAKIVTLKKDVKVSVKEINVPAEWVRYIKKIDAIDENNYICYSRNIFLIETENYKHMYLEFPPFTAVFYYGDYILLGTKSGDILLYQLSIQKKAGLPVFQTLAKLPEEKFAVQLDVCERRTGPVVIAATFFEIFLLDIKFFPHEDTSKTTFTMPKISMYKRLLKLRGRLQERQQRNQIIE